VSQRQGLTVSPAVRRAIVAHARRDRPLECCGLLLGRGTSIVFAVPTPNVVASPVRYRVDPMTHIDVQRVLRLLAPPLDIVGVYHSHPAGEPLPSPTDIAEASYPEWAHIIIGFRSGRPLVNAFTIQRGRVRALRIQWSMIRRG